MKTKAVSISGSGLCVCVLSSLVLSFAPPAAGNDPPGCVPPPGVHECMVVTGRRISCPDGAICTTTPPEHVEAGEPGLGDPRYGDAHAPAVGNEDRGGTGQHDHPEPEGASSGCWKDLVAGETSVTSGFRTAARPTHKGIDLRCATGTSVYAAEAGTITEIPKENMPENTLVTSGPGTTGNMIEVTYLSGRVARYLHLLPRSKGGIVVKEGQTVSAGQFLGSCNNTGYSRGAHLHYDLEANGEYVNPEEAHDCE